MWSQTRAWVWGWGLRMFFFFKAEDGIRDLTVTGVQTCALRIFEVVTIGTELLLGHTVDTNAAELGRALAAAGAEITRRTTVPDRPDAIRAAVAEALDRTGFVIATGGLGPTRDDMTKTVVAELVGKRLVLDEG